MKLNKQARANERAYEEIYRQMEDKWTKQEVKDESGKIIEKAGRWAEMTQEQIRNEHRIMLKQNVSELRNVNTEGLTIDEAKEKVKEANEYADYVNIVQNMVQNNRTLGYEYADEKLIDTIKKVQNKKYDVES